MSIRKQQEPEEFIPARQYTHAELEKFHQDIQKFWQGEKFLNEELHVAYGAASKEPSGQKADGSPHFYYQYHSERYHEFTNLWRQYETWRVNQEYLAKEAVAF